MKRAFLGLSLLVASLFVLFGCGGGGSDVGGRNPLVRAVTVFPNVQTVNVTAREANGNEIVIMQGQTFGSRSQIVQFPRNGNYTITFRDAANNQVLGQGTALFEENQAYTIVGFDGANPNNILLLQNNRLGSAPGVAAVRFVNAGINQPVDVYYLRENETIAGMQPKFTNVGPGSATAHGGAFVGNGRFVVTAAGTQTIIENDVLPLQDGHSYTIVAGNTGQSSQLVLVDETGTVAQ
ncbi:MAG TPA: DUF4397 domain-containing protein [Fimbriimonadaceae bacterium]|nr:DUF4397 domain-containing protein [Fimbriimonadaceae bacterium]